MNIDTEKPQKKKLLVTASTFPRWGDDINPAFVYELSKRLKGTFQVFVSAPYSDGSKLTEERDGMRIHRYRFFPSKKLFTDGAIIPSLKKNKLFYLQVPFFFLKQLVEIRKLVKKHKIDIIHAHWIIPQGLVAVIYKKLFNRRVKIVITSHGGDIYGLSGSFFTRIKKWVLNNSSGLTVVSNAIKERIYKIGFSNDIPVEVISMGVDLARFSPDNYDEGIKKEFDIKGAFLLFVGRLSEKKGVDYLIKAMPEVIKKFPDAKLVIIGSGEEEEKYYDLARQLGLYNKSIIFAGAVLNHKLPKYYATADIFIGPSIVAKGGDAEGFGLIFVEALGSGCTVIATDLPAISDVVIDGKTGFVVKQKKSDQISEKIIYLLNNKSVCDSIKEAGLKHVLSNYDWGVVSKKYAEYLAKM